jgi:hypothetical protein
MDGLVIGRLLFYSVIARRLAKLCRGVKPVEDAFAALHLYRRFAAGLLRNTFIAAPHK